MSDKENVNDDPELLDLLDCAVKDFDKPVELKKKIEKKEKENEQLGFEEVSGHSSKPPSQELWGFSKLEEALCSLLSEDKDLKDDLKCFSESTQQQDDDIATSLTNTLKGLAANAENIFDSSSEDMQRLLENIAKNDENSSDEGIPNIFPLMQDVMQKLLSKELLYPALKDIVNKYPEWLKEKQGVLQDKEYQCYSKQYELMKQVCNEFEMEDDESSTSQKERFERVMVLMQKMQDCGHPPKELIGEMAPEIEFDGQGNPKIPGLQGDQCCIM